MQRQLFKSKVGEQLFAYYKYGQANKIFCIKKS